MPQQVLFIPGKLPVCRAIWGPQNPQVEAESSRLQGTVMDFKQALVQYQGLVCVLVAQVSHGAHIQAYALLLDGATGVAQERP